MPISQEFAKSLSFADDAALIGLRSGKAASAKSRRKQQQDIDPLDPDQSRFFRILETGANQVFGMGAFAGMMGLSVLGAVSGKLHQWGVPGMGKLSGGVKSAQELTLARVGEITGLGGVARRVSNASMSALAVGVDGLKLTGVTGVLASRHEGKLESVMPKVQAKIAALTAHQAAHPEVKAALDQVLADAQHVGQSWAQRQNMYSVAGREMNYAGLIGHVQGLAHKHGDKALVGHLNDFAKVSDKAQKHFELHDGYTNLSEYTRNATPAMAKAPVMHAALNAGILVGTTISAYRTGYSAHKGMKALRDLYCETTGKKPGDVSTFTLLFGSVPQPVKAARGQFFKEFGPAGAMDAVNVVFNGHWAITGRGSMLILMALGVGSQLMREALAGDILPTFSAVKEMQAQGQPVPADAYATLAGEASKELRVRGGGHSDFAQALGKIYEREQIKLHDLLAEIDDGRMKKRIDRLQAEFVEHRKEQANLPHKAVAASVETPLHDGKSHVQRLAEPKAVRPVLGTETQKLHEAAITAQQHPTHSVSA